MVGAAEAKEKSPWLKRAKESFDKRLERWEKHPEWKTMPAVSLAVIALVHGLAAVAPTQAANVRDFFYGLVQMCIAPRPSAEPVIINIHGLNHQLDWPDKPGVKYTTTDRGGLEKIVSEVALKHPVAIGVDVDMSPTPSGYTTPTGDSPLPPGRQVDQDSDPTVFANWGAMKNPRVFVGAMRTVATTYDPTAGFLGAPNLNFLAASLTVPKEALQDGSSVVKYLVDSVTVGNGPKLQTLGYAMGTQEWADEGSDSLLWEVHKSPFGPSSFGAVGRPIDYSALGDMQHNALTPDQIGSIASFSNRLVFLGDLQSSDQFLVPPHTQVPGVLLHASMAYTVPEPLKETSGYGTALADALLIAIAVGLYYGLLSAVERLWPEKRKKPTEGHIHAVTTVLLLSALAVIFFGFVSRVRLVVDDLPLVFIAVVFDWIIHHLHHKAKHKRHARLKTAEATA